MKEVIRIGRESGVKIHFSHFKVCGKNNWKYLDEAFGLLEEANEQAHHQQQGVYATVNQGPAQPPPPA